MAHIPGTIELNKLVHVTIVEKKNKAGKIIKLAMIPLELNHIVEKDGRMFLNFIGFETPKSEYNSHGIKVSLPKALRESMTKEQKNEMPFIGGLKLESENNNQQSAPATTQNDDFNNSSDNDEEDNLPF